MTKKLQSITGKAAPAAAIAVILIIWYFCSDYEIIPAYMLPSPGKVASAFCNNFGIMLKQASVTLQEALYGLLIGITLAFVLAVLMDSFDFLYKALYPVLVISQTIPTIAIAPLLVLWMGFGMAPKITLVVRREEDGIKRYVHLGTGNYNDSTAKQYTDVGLFTCAPAIGEDATAVFNMLSGYSEPLGWNKLSLAPLWLKDRIISLIKREEDHARAGESAHIIAKMNSICHQEVIAALYSASRAGVKIDLIVRGICCLKTGIPGISDNITVTSIVGNFLEHSRIFYFENGGLEEYYASSADWMPRNLERRVEILFPIEDERLREKVWEVLDTELKDTEKAHVMTDDGEYVKKSELVKKDAVRINSQKAFGEKAKEIAKRDTSVNSRVFIPEMSPNINV